MDPTTQHPKITLEWALHCLETAIRNLGDGPAEARVRRQFHQVLLAVEREARLIDVRSRAKTGDNGEATEQGSMEERHRVLVV